MVPEVNRFFERKQEYHRWSFRVRRFVQVASSVSCLWHCGLWFRACDGQSCGAATPPVTFTADQDHQNMMDQLGIKALRPGPSGNEKAPNHANYDESLANPYPNVPDPLTMNDGAEGDDGGDVVGQAPAGDCGDVGEVCLRAGAGERAQGDVDGDGGGSRDIGLHAGDGEGADWRGGQLGVSGDQREDHMTLVTPANAKGPVPVLMMFGPARFPNPNEPLGEDLERVNAAMKALLVQQDHR